jgi:hypothetical protein
VNPSTKKYTVGNPRRIELHHHELILLHELAEIPFLQNDDVFVVHFRLLVLVVVRRLVEIGEVLKIVIIDEIIFRMTRIRGGGGSCRRFLRGSCRSSSSSTSLESVRVSEEKRRRAVRERRNGKENAGERNVGERNGKENEKIKK